MEKTTEYIMFGRKEAKMIRLATQDDLDFIDQHGPLLTRTVLADKIEREEVYVADSGG